MQCMANMPCMTWLSEKIQTLHIFRVILENTAHVQRTRRSPKGSHLIHWTSAVFSHIALKWTQFANRLSHTSYASGRLHWEHIDGLHVVRTVSSSGDCTGEGRGSVPRGGGGGSEGFVPYGEGVRGGPYPTFFTTKCPQYLSKLPK